jgi:hypothetical protein
MCSRKVITKCNETLSKWCKNKHGASKIIDTLEMHQAPWTSSSGNNPFHTLIHELQFQKVPRSRLPSSWDIDHSNSAGKESSKCEEEWGNNSKSWDSQSDMFMSCIEFNLEMIHNLTYKIDELKELIEKLIKDLSPPPKE